MRQSIAVVEHKASDMPALGFEEHWVGIGRL